jgi:hypothetical protein
MPPDGVPPLEEIRRRVIREIVDADIQSARRRPRTRGFRSMVQRRAAQLLLRAITRGRRLR